MSKKFDYIPFSQKIRDKVFKKLNKKIFDSSLIDNSFQQINVQSFLKNQVFKEESSVKSWINYLANKTKINKMVYENIFNKTNSALNNINSSIEADVDTASQMLNDDQKLEIMIINLALKKSNINLSISDENLKKAFEDSMNILQKLDETNNNDSKIELKEKIEELIANLLKTMTENLDEAIKILKIEKFDGECPLTDDVLKSIVFNSSQRGFEKAIKIFMTLSPTFSKNPWIKKLADKLGRNEKNDTREKTFSNTEVNGKTVKTYARGNKINQIKKTEFALPESLFWQKFAEKSLKIEVGNNTPKPSFFTDNIKESKVDKGDVLICVDTSGSMSNFETLTKAIVASLISNIDDERKVHLVAFDVNTKSIIINKNFAEDLNFLNFIKKEFSGGTDINEGIIKSIEAIEEQKMKNSDIVVISDYYCDDLYKETKDKIKNCKYKPRLFGVNVDSDNHINKNFAVKNNFNDIISVSDSHEQITKQLNTWNKK